MSLITTTVSSDHLPTTAMPSARQFHLVIQPYNDPHPKRAGEIEYCLRMNVANAHISKIHVLLEKDSFIPKDCMESTKVVVVENSPRMTFQNAFGYAKRALPKGSMLCVANSDIYLDQDTDWEKECSNGRTQCLTRFEEHPNGDKTMLFGSYVCGNSADTWIVDVDMVHKVQDCDFRVGNQMGCDGAIAHRFVKAGLLPVNEAGRLKTYHVDACIHRNRYNKCVYEEGSGVNHSSEKTYECGEGDFPTRRGRASVKVRKEPHRVLPKCAIDRHTLEYDFYDDCVGYLWRHGNDIAVEDFEGGNQKKYTAKFMETIVEKEKTATKTTSTSPPKQPPDTQLPATQPPDTRPQLLVDNNPHQPNQEQFSMDSLVLNN
jgi:hypothetical protein